jgi:rhamnosyl/mannosyltransferase
MAAKFGENALKRYNELFKADDMAKSYSKIYQSLLKF